MDHRYEIGVNVINGVASDIIDKVKSDDNNIAIVSINDMREAISIPAISEGVAYDMLKRILLDYNIIVNTDNNKDSSKILIFIYSKELEKPGIRSVSKLDFLDPILVYHIEKFDDENELSRVIRKINSIEYYDKLLDIVIDINNILKNDDIDATIINVYDMRRILGIPVGYEYVVYRDLSSMLQDYNVVCGPEIYNRVRMFKNKAEDITVNVDNNTKCSLCNELRCGSYHHIIPRSMNGMSLDTNLVFLCNKCHDDVEIVCSGCIHQIRKICNVDKFIKCWKNDMLYFKKIQ